MNGRVGGLFRGCFEILPNRVGCLFLGFLQHVVDDAGIEVGGLREFKFCTVDALLDDFLRVGAAIFKPLA